MNSNVKGAVAEQAIVLAATKAGIPVLRPVAEHGRTDLALDIDGDLLGVQVKWGRLSPRRDVVIARIGTCRCTPHGYVRGTYAEHEVDLFAVYRGDLDRCFLLPAQMLANIILFGLPLQASLEMPRLVSLGRHPFTDPWGAEREPTLAAIEDRVPAATRDELERRGHVLEDLGSWSNTVGSGVAILRQADGVLEGGADPRRDAQACGW